jgi:hypothetical protein
MPRKRTIPHVCEQCNKPFLGHDAQSRYCSKDCKHAAQRVPKMPLEERFWSKVDKSGECWLWTANRDRKGYGRFHIIKGIPEVASRVAWKITHGEIPADKIVCHSCDNPACVRPDHLFLGTYRDNSNDMMAKGRRHYRLTPEQVGEIRSRYIRGITTMEALGAEYGVSSRTVCNIVNRKQWKHVA